MVKPHVAAMRALAGGPKEQIEFLLMFEPLALQDCFTYGDRNVCIKRRELRAACNAAWARLQHTLMDKE